MNEKKRGMLMDARSHLDRAGRLITQVRDDEQESLDNMPENLEGSDRYEKMENAISELEDALDDIVSASECVDRAKE